MFSLIEETTGIHVLMEGNVERHNAFKSGLAEFHGVFNNKPQDYNGDELRAIFDPFGYILQKHLQDEIKTPLGLQI